jgi:hypothetical protein
VSDVRIGHQVVSVANDFVSMAALVGERGYRFENVMARLTLENVAIHIDLII